MIPSAPSIPKTSQTLTGHALVGSPSAVAQLDALGFDTAKYGKPGRAMIRPHFQGIKFVGPIKGKAGLTGFAGDLIFEPRFEDCVFTVQHVPTTHKDESKWGGHPFNLYGATFKNCAFINVCKEHGLYPHGMAGDTLFEDCTWDYIGAQALQVAERWKHHGGTETFAREFLTCPGTITVRRGFVRNVGKPSGVGSASFNFAFYGPQSDDPASPVISNISAVSVVIEDTMIQHRDSLSGAFVFQRRPLWIVDGSRLSIRTTGTNGVKPLIFSEKSQAGQILGLQSDGKKIDVLDMPKGKLVLSGCSGTTQVRLGSTVSGKVTYKAIGTLSSLGDCTI